MKFSLICGLLPSLILAIYCLPANAQSRGCSDFQHIALVSISLPRQASQEDRARYACADFQLFDDQLDEMKKISPFQVQPLILIAGRPPLPGEALYNAMYRHIAVAYNPRDPKDVENVKKVFAHEVGHYIFQSHLNEKFPVLAEMSRARERLDQLVPFMAQVAKMMEADPSCRVEGSECKKQITDLYNALPEEVRNSEKNLNKFMEDNEVELKRVMGPDAAFHELYGDVVAAVFFNDPDVNMDRTSGVRGAERSFVQPLGDFRPTEEPHGAFAAIRRDLWKQWILPRMGNKKELLRKLAEAFSAEIEIQAKEGIVDAATSVARLRKRLKLRETVVRSDSADAPADSGSGAQSAL